MDEQRINHKNHLPTLKVWSKIESNRLLLEPRPQIISTIFRLVAMAALAMHAPLVLVAVWVVLIFSTNYWMRSLIATYAALLEVKPNPFVGTTHMASVVQSYKQAWLLNCMVWGGLSFISQIWLSDVPRFICIAVLNALMLLSITRTHVNTRLMHGVSAILIVSQLTSAIVRFVILDDNAESVYRLSAHAIYLFLMWYLLWVVGNRFNLIHMQRLDSEYAKLQLIETLNQNKTQLHLEQQALTASNKLVQQFYSGAAHDLRQPVYAMQLYTSMLSDDPSLNKVLLPKITQSCDSINDMFNTLFDYQQTHMNDTELVEKDICIQEVLKSLALHFQPIATGKGLQIRFKPISGTITMVPLYLTRILSNLISNALRYTNTGGVLVAVRKTHEGIHFEIWDTGIGIDDSKLKHIFNEFYKVNKVDVANDGLGLGLAIAKQLSMRVDQTDISVKSRPGRGSVFMFTVPLKRYKAI
jgi:signal transduction histidine kinase